jgi:hypothetical protein
MYSELDENRWEHRKAEIFADGRCDYASESESKGNSGLSEEPLPTSVEIALDPQFEPVEISKDDFEKIWNQAHE